MDRIERTDRIDRTIEIDLRVSNMRVSISAYLCRLVAPLDFYLMIYDHAHTSCFYFSVYNIPFSFPMREEY